MELKRLGDRKMLQTRYMNREKSSLTMIVVIMMIMMMMLMIQSLKKSQRGRNESIGHAWKRGVTPILATERKERKVHCIALRTERNAAW